MIVRAKLATYVNITLDIPSEVSDKDAKEYLIATAYDHHFPGDYSDWKIIKCIERPEIVDKLII
jgi:hypothetical protein